MSAERPRPSHLRNNVDRYGRSGHNFGSSTSATLPRIRPLHGIIQDSLDSTSTRTNTYGFRLRIKIDDERATVLIDGYADIEECAACSQAHRQLSKGSQFACDQQQCAQIYGLLRSQEYRSMDESTNHIASERSVTAYLGDIVSFIIPLTSFFQINIVGQLYGPDILLACCLPFLLTTRPDRSTKREFRKFLIFLGIWLFGAIITDFVRQTPLDDVARGWSKIIVFGINSTSLFYLSFAKFSRIVLYAAGLAIGSIITAIVSPSDFSKAEPWKFGYGTGITILCVILIESPYVKSTIYRSILGKWTFVPLMVTLAVANLILNFRSMFGILLAATAFCGVILLLRSGTKNISVSRTSFVALCLMAVFTFQGISGVYSWAAESGFLGLDAKDKYQAQHSNDLGLLLGGRVEALVSTRAIADSPVIGHGSWARDVSYVAQLVDILEASGVRVEGNPFESDLIPSHSHLFGAWVEAGCLGGLFWIWALWLSVRGLYSALNVRLERPIFVAFQILIFFWDILFSPFGANQRFVDNMRFCLIFWLLRAALSAKRRRIEEGLSSSESN